MNVLCRWGGCHVVLESQPELWKHFREVHQPELAQLWKIDLNAKTGQHDRVYNCRWRTSDETYCTKTCHRLENFKCHTRVHTGDKPFRCTFEGCSKSFSSLGERIKHESRTHSKERPYVCDADDCDKSYKDPSALRKHMMAVHSADEYDKYKIRNAAQRKRKQQVAKKEFTLEEFSALQQMAQNFLNGQQQNQAEDVSYEQYLNEPTEIERIEQHDPYLDRNSCAQSVQDVGMEIEVSTNEHKSVNHVGDPFAPPVGSLSYKDFSTTKLNRYMTRENADKSRPCPPQPCLHWFNAPPDMHENKLKKALTKAGVAAPINVSQHRLATVRSAAGTCEFTSIQETTEALIPANHTPVHTLDSRRPFVLKQTYTKSLGPNEHGGPQQTYQQKNSL